MFAKVKIRGHMFSFNLFMRGFPFCRIFSVASKESNLLGILENGLTTSIKILPEKIAYLDFVHRALLLAQSSAKSCDSNCVVSNLQNYRTIIIVNSQPRRGGGGLLLTDGCLPCHGHLVSIVINTMRIITLCN